MYALWQRYGLQGHEAHHEAPGAHGLTEQVQGMSVSDKPEHHEGEHPKGHHGGLKETIAGLKEKRHRKKERK